MAIAKEPVGQLLLPAVFLAFCCSRDTRALVFQGFHAPMREEEDEAVERQLMQVCALLGPQDEAEEAEAGCLETLAREGQKDEKQKDRNVRPHRCL